MTGNDNSAAADLRGMTLEELQDWLAAMQEPAFRAKQLFSWLHEKQAADTAAMSNIPAALRRKIDEEAGLVTLTSLIERVSSDGTRKYLLRLPDDETVECVLMQYHYGYSLCISSQVGCRMGCSFCASAKGGLIRNLAASEMLEQVYAIQRIAGVRISHVVVMGTGEPLDNYDSLLRFLRLISDERGQNMSLRNITVSTCGLVDRIRDLAEEDLPITLAVSLHAVSDEKRRQLMPIANRYYIAEILDACRVYFRETGRRITFEYSLISGVNDSEEDAEALAKIAGSVHAHVNLIPVNPAGNSAYRAGTRRAVQAFHDRLENRGINVSIRRVLGQDIEGACGQLRHRRLNGEI